SPRRNSFAWTTHRTEPQTAQVLGSDRRATAIVLPPLRRSRRSQPLSRFEQDGGCRFPCLHIEEFRHAAALQHRNWGMCGLLEGAFGFAARRSSGLTITPTSTRRCGPARAVPVFEYEVFELPATMWAGPHQLLLSLDDRAALIQVGITCRTDA